MLIFPLTLQTPFPGGLLGNKGGAIRRGESFGFCLRRIADGPRGGSSRPLLSLRRRRSSRPCPCPPPTRPPRWAPPLPPPFPPRCHPPPVTQTPLGPHDHSWLGQQRQFCEMEHCRIPRNHPPDRSQTPLRSSWNTYLLHFHGYFFHTFFRLLLRPFEYHLVHHQASNTCAVSIFILFHVILLCYIAFIVFRVFLHPLKIC